MSLPIIYCRLEPSLESEVVQYVDEKQRREKKWWDVVCYSNRRAFRRDFVARFPCTYTQSKPTKSHKYTNLNCVRREIVWLPDKQVQRLPTPKNYRHIRDAINRASNATTSTN